MSRRQMLLLLLPLLLLLVSSTGLSQPAPPGPTRPPGPVGPPSFGLNTHLATRYPDPASMHEAAAIVEELGVSWVREDLHWHRVQRLPDAWDWTFTDAALRELLNRDIQVVGVLGPSVGWATPYPGDTRTDVSFHPPDPAAFAAYAGAVVRRYRRYIKHWEVWNEPDNQLFWQPQPDPLAYADLLMRTSEAIKAADPDARVLIGGVNPFDSTFLRKVAEVGAWQSFDILAIHPYIDPYTPEEGNIVASLDKMHALTSQYGAKPIWATEIGWASGPGDRDALGKTDAANQANFLVRSLLLLWQAGVERSFWYMLKDDAHNPYGLVEYGRGRTDFREELRKPAFYALRTLNRELRDVQFVERRDLFDSTIAINFSKAGAWQRANQPNGQLDSSTVGVGRIRYNFSTAGNDYVVFERVQPVPLAGEPYALGVWIYGDGTDHALKAWLRDAEGEVLQFRLGIVGAPGWHFVSTPLRVPVTGGDIIAGQGNQRLDFPATLTALVLDDGYDAYVGTSTIYLDDVTAIYGREVYNLRFKQVQGGGALDVIWSPPGLRITLNTRALNGSLVTLRGEAQNIAAAGGRFALNVGGSQSSCGMCASRSGALCWLRRGRRGGHLRWMSCGRVRRGRRSRVDITVKAMAENNDIYKAFMSYTRHDDEQNGGHLTAFCNGLSGAVQTFTGQPFRIFQDIKDIAWGQPFEERIDAVLRATQFFIPIITPSFFQSTYCCAELTRFLKRAEELGRSDLILPVYYVECDELEDASIREHNELARVLATRNWVDWRELYFEDFGRPPVKKMLAQMARQIRDTLKRIEAERQAQPEAESPEAAHNRAVMAYLGWLQREYARLDQPGLGVKPIPLDLATVHVPLRVVERGEMEQYYRTMRGEVDAESMRRVLGRKQANQPGRIFALLSDTPDAVAQPHQPPRTTKRLLLLGDAGSGKTTTLRYAALRLADAYRQQNPALLADAETGLGLVVQVVPLPLYVRLTHFAITLPDDLKHLPLAERQRYTGMPPELFLTWLDQEATKVCGAPAGWLAAQLTRPGSHVLLLLDGLDEAGDEQRRANLARLITNLANAYPDHRYVVASRTAGYGGRVLLPDFLERHINPLNTEEAQAVVRKWFGAVSQHQADQPGGPLAQATTQASLLWSAIERSPRLGEMATNPLLLTAMALLQYNNVRLPDQRARLYEELVKLLLKVWREKQIADGMPVVTEAQLAAEQRRIAWLALQMQQQPGQVREVALKQAQAWLSPLYIERFKIGREEADERVATALTHLTVDSGLIQCRDNRYCFAHYTLQEYLAAWALDALDERTTAAVLFPSVQFLLEQCHDARWRETLLLAVGHWSNGQQFYKARQLLAGLLAATQQPEDALLLAAEALADTGEVEEFTGLRGEVVTRLQALAFASPPICPDPRTRNAAAELLDRLDADDRNALKLTHPDYWATPIAPGPFLMGDDSSNYKREKPAFVYHIRRPYALARFPVTNRQYKQFLDDLERQGREEEAQQRRPRGWSGASYRVGTGNHPVVEVSWEDASAFARWADEYLRAQGLLQAGEEVRLPTEPEWERAATYPVTLPPNQPGAGKRVYPWGNEWHDESVARGFSPVSNDMDNHIPVTRANTTESRIGGTSVVGIFPYGAADCSAEELAGNVWEWCSSRYQDYPLPDEVIAETIYISEEYYNKRCVLRGGSWLDGASYARGVSRGDRSLDSFYFNLGLRLARCSHGLAKLAIHE